MLLELVLLELVLLELVSLEFVSLVLVLLVLVSLELESRQLYSIGSSIQLLFDIKMGGIALALLLSPLHAGLERKTCPNYFLLKLSSRSAKKTQAKNVNVFFFNPVVVGFFGAKIEIEIEIEIRDLTNPVHRSIGANFLTSDN